MTFSFSSSHGTSNEYERVTLSASTVTANSEKNDKKQTDIVEKQLKTKLDDLEKKYLRMSEQKV